MMYTTDQAAALLETARRNIQNYCLRHNLPKFGREYMITETDIEGMKNELGKPGKKPANVANERGSESETKTPTAPESQK